MALDRLGWSALYSQHLTVEDLAAGFPARVSAVQRSGLTVLSEQGTIEIAPLPQLAITVGDWVLVERDAPRVLRVIERKTLLARMAAGDEQRLQLIAANLDTLFIVTSCNADFNLSRLERYLAIARAAHIEPVIVLTKADLCAETESYVEQARSIAGAANIVALNATLPDAIAALQPWLVRGATVAFVGSSGVGKSTLVNTLAGSVLQATAGIREDDARGRHTTTSRQMFATPGGTWVIDTPGMRELKVGVVESGLSEVFADVEALARECKFRDCGHQGDAGCALEAAVAENRLDARRLTSFLKLQRESQRAALSERERREKERSFGRMARTVMRDKQRRRDDS